MFGAGTFATPEVRENYVARVTVYRDELTEAFHSVFNQVDRCLRGLGPQGGLHG